MQAQEMLTLLNTLKPVHERQPAYLESMKSWGQQRGNYLQQSNQPAEALKLQAELAKNYRHDYSLQGQYAQSLWNAGEHEAAYAWLAAALASDFPWHVYEQDAMRSQVTQLLEQEGQFDALQMYLANWIEVSPESTSPYGPYLSILVRNDDFATADRLVKRWLKLAANKPDLSPAEMARLQAAVSLTLGQGSHLYTNRIDERWLPVMAEAVRDLAENPKLMHLANQIISHSQFVQTDNARDLRKRFLDRLVDNIDTLPGEQIGMLVSWIGSGEPIVEKPTWRKIAAAWRNAGSPSRSPRPSISLLSR